MSTQNKAYRYGQKVAVGCKKLHETIKQWDQATVSYAQKYKLPTWIGHISVAALLLISVSALLLGGFVVIGTILCFWALILVLRLIYSQPQKASLNEHEKEYPIGTRFRSGPHGWGWYDSTGFMHDEDDDQ